MLNLKKNGTLAMLQPDLMGRAMRTFDKSSGIVVLTVWLAAIIFMVLTYASVQQTVAARQEMAAAQAAQPILPEIKQEPVPVAQIDKYIERIAKRYGNRITITNGNGEVRVTASAPDAYSTWMDALGYLDTIAPDVSWAIKEFCVGPECKDGLMAARLIAQRITFATPTPAN